MKTRYCIILLLAIILLPLSLFSQVNPEDINDWRGKTILYFAPHPDDEVRGAGTMAILAANGNNIYVVVYCNGSAGSKDPAMTSERLAQIRKKEDEEAMKVLGIPPENIIWLGYDDGTLEDVPQKELREKVCRLIRKYRPDAVFSLDPGEKWMQWHKTTHRMAAFMTVDGARAAAYFLVFPHHKTYEGLEPFEIKDFFFYDSREPDFKVDITDVIDIKVESICKYTSQKGNGNNKYIGPDMLPEDREKQRKWYSKKEEDGRIYEPFRRVRESLSF